MAKPETISTFIEANKDQFTSRELDRINSKLIVGVDNNVKGLVLNADNEPNEYNGYNKVIKEKVYNFILFFAEGVVLKTKLLKEMFYTDFLYYKNTCKSITGLEYAKLQFGPVPDQFESILNESIQETRHRTPA